jgi:hypothetical protein
MCRLCAFEQRRFQIGRCFILSSLSLCVCVLRLSDVSSWVSERVRVFFEVITMLLMMLPPFRLRSSLSSKFSFDFVRLPVNMKSYTVGLSIYVCIYVVRRRHTNTLARHFPFCAPLLVSLPLRCHFSSCFLINKKCGGCVAGKLNSMMYILFPSFLHSLNKEMFCVC